ncbi:retrotransposon protein, putative, ty1-copia subclass [Tanacetum coccineum]
MAKPMTKLTKKNIRFDWSEKAEAAFRLLKQKLCSAPILALPEGIENFVVYYDTSRKGVCAVLMQREKLTPPYTPQHNGVSERRNRTNYQAIGEVLLKARIVELKRRNYKVYCADSQYVISIKKIRRICALTSQATTKTPSLIRRIQKKPYAALVKRDTLDKLQQRSVKCIFVGYQKKTMGYYFYFPPKKIVVARYAEFLEKNLISQEANKRAIELEEIQKSERKHQDPKCLCLNVKVEEHSLGDLNEPANYKAALLDPKSIKWLDAMNAKMQSMKDNQV